VKLYRHTRADADEYRGAGRQFPGNRIAARKSTSVRAAILKSLDEPPSNQKDKIHARQKKTVKGVLMTRLGVRQPHGKPYLNTTSRKDPKKRKGTSEPRRTEQFGQSGRLRGNRRGKWTTPSAKPKHRAHQTRPIQTSDRPALR